MRLRARILLLCWFALEATIAWAAGSASVAGTVLGEGRSPLREVEVGLINLSTGKTELTRTDIAGKFGFAELASEEYSLYFELPEYAAQRIGPFELLPDSPREWVVELERLQPPLTRPLAGLDIISVEYGMVREQIQSLPVLLGSEGRTSIDKLLNLVPGMNPVDSLELDPMSGRASAVSANGSRSSAINYQFDGAPNNAQNRLTGAQAATFAPVPDAIETFRVITHTYSASEGRNAGAVVFAGSRTMRDRLHGGLRGFYRPYGNAIESYDAAKDSLKGWDGGGQLGGPLWAKHNLNFFFDAESWKTQQRHFGVYDVLSAAERSGDLSELTTAPLDPASGAFPNGMIPQDRLSPLMQKYLNAFLPRANAGQRVFQGREDLPSNGQTLLARIDKGWKKFSLSASHLTYRADAASPLPGALPSVSSQRRQLANNTRVALQHTPSAELVQTTQVSGQRLSIALWQGMPDYRNVTANEFGFDFAQFGADPATIPDVTLYDDAGRLRMLLTPFLRSEQSVQTTWQVRHDLEWRRGGYAARLGGSYQEGGWPFRNTENPAGSMSFPAPPSPPQARTNGLRDLLLGRIGQYRATTPRDLNLQWREFAAYGEAELRPLRSLRVTVGLRLESQPPAVDSQDRVAAFRAGRRSERFPETLPGLIFPGDQDGDMGILPRSTVEWNGKQFVPRVGIAWSPTSDSLLSRALFGPSGRSAVRASYGQFYDFGAFAGSSAAALFQATYPPFSVDNRFEYARLGTTGSFRSPLAGIPENDPDLISLQPSYPILVFDREFQNASARHWNFGLQRPLPGGVNLSVVYVGTRSIRLQRQRELNEFFRNFASPFSNIRNMRQFTSLRNVRQFESSGRGRYNALQIRGNRYLRRGLAFDAGYTWSRSDDDGSSVLGEGLSTENWSVSAYDRRHSFAASWIWEPRLPRSWSSRLSAFDNWTVSGVWRLRSGLPLDIRQREDPTFTFVRVGRPDVTAAFQALDPSVIRTFTVPDGRTITGRFAFDPTIFKAVVPTIFDETRPGNVGRNAFRMRGYQQWDVRLSRALNVAEGVAVDFGLDLINVFGNRNWDTPFSTVEDPAFGVVRGEGIGRSYQAVVRLDF